MKIKNTAVVLGGLLISTLTQAAVTIPAGCTNPGDCEELTPTFKNVTIRDDIRLADLDNSHYVGFKSGGVVTSNLIWTLPTSDGQDGEVLKTDGAGILSWGRSLGAEAASIQTNADPATNLGGASAGDIAYDSTDNELQIFDGTNWVAVDNTIADTNTQLTQAEVGTFATAEGFIKTDTNTQLTQAEVGTFATAEGFIKTDTNTQLTDAEVGAFGYIKTDNDNQDLSISGNNLSISGGTGVDLSGLTTTTGSIQTNADPATNLGGASAGDIAYDSTDNELQIFDGTNWVAVDNTIVDTNTQLDETAVDAFVANNGYITSFTETDPNVTAFAKVALPTCGVGEVLKGDGTSLSCVTDANSGGGKFIDGTTDPADAVFTAGNVGIGTASPNAKLELVGAAELLKINNTTGSSYVQFINSGSTGTGEYIGSVNDDLTIWTENIRRLTIDSIGKVGIGTIVPAEQLEVINSIGISGSDTGIIRFKNLANSDHASLGIKNGGLTLSGNSSAIMDGSEHLYIANSGNIGIGTIIPARKLTVKANMAGFSTELGAASGGVLQALYFSHDLTGDFTSYIGSSGTNQGDLQIGAGTTGGNGIRIKRLTGNVGIGTISPGSKLSVIGLPSGISDTVTPGALVGAICITDLGNMYIDIDGSCVN